jgi:hypothetical protein
VSERERNTWFGLSLLVGYIGSDLIVAEAAHSIRNLPYTLGGALIFAALVMLIRSFL